MYEERAKSLRWLAFNFPHIDNPQDDSDKMCNCINLYCTQAADAIEELSRVQEQWIMQERNALLKEIEKLKGEKNDYHSHKLG